MKGKLYLVTGGTGFLGFQLIKRLLDDGALVRVMARKPSTDLDKLGNIDYFKGSVTDREAVLEAAQGVSGIFHLAGLVYHTRQQHLVQEMWETNVGGTMNVMRAAKAVKCRVVYASSSGTVGCSRRRGYVANDNAPYCDDIAQHWPYYKSKIESEIQAMEYARNNDIELMIMRPSMMLGPDDFYLRATKLIWNFLERKIPFTPLGGVSFVDVRDVADAFKAAMVVNRPNSTFLLGSKNCSVEDLFIILEQISGIPKPKLKLPAIVAKAASLALDTTNRKLLNKWDPGVDPVRVEMANHFWNIDWSKAMRELKFKPRSFEKTLADNINWLREAKSRGLVPDHAHPAPSAAPARETSSASTSHSEEEDAGSSEQAVQAPPPIRSKL